LSAFFGVSCILSSRGWDRPKMGQEITRPKRRQIAAVLRTIPE
jgi:hypothetical protein